MVYWYTAYILTHPCKPPSNPSPHPWHQRTRRLYTSLGYDSTFYHFALPCFDQICPHWRHNCTTTFIRPCRGNGTHLNYLSEEINISVFFVCTLGGIRCTFSSGESSNCRLPNQLSACSFRCSSFGRCNWELRKKIASSDAISDGWIQKVMTSYIAQPRYYSIACVNQKLVSVAR